MLVFEKSYSGFESMNDISRDVEEALDAELNPAMEGIPAELKVPSTLQSHTFPLNSP